MQEDNLLACMLLNTADMSGGWKYFSSCWVPSQAALNSATLVTDHSLPLAPQWGVNISELMHKSCTPGFQVPQQRDITLGYFWAQRSMDYFLTLQMENTWRSLMLNTQTGSANSWKPLPPSPRQHLSDVLLTRAPCQDWQTPQAVFTHGTYWGPTSLEANIWS